MLGNPLIEPWNELAALCEDFDMNKYLFGSYYICRAVKPLAGPAAADADAWYDEVVLDPAHRIAAE